MPPPSEARAVPDAARPCFSLLGFFGGVFPRGGITTTPPLGVHCSPPTFSTVCALIVAICARKCYTVDIPFSEVILMISDDKVRVSISLPVELVPAFKSDARDLNMSLSSYVFMLLAANSTNLPEELAQSYSDKFNFLIARGFAGE